MATWFKTNQSNFNEPAHIVNKGGFNNDKFGKNMNYGIWMNVDGTITGGFESQSGENFEILSEKRYNDGKWHYVLLSYDGSLLRLDIDGEKQVSTKNTNGVIPDTTGDQPLRIGANSLDESKFFTGNIDEVRVWNRALTDYEINELYDNKYFNFTGQVEYLNFGKNTMNYNGEIFNTTITNGTKDIQTTAKLPAVIFVILISEETLEKIQTTAKSPIVETSSPDQSITQIPLSNNASFIDNAIHWIDDAKASFFIKTNK